MSGKPRMAVGIGIALLLIAGSAVLSSLVIVSPGVTEGRFGWDLHGFGPLAMLPVTGLLILTLVSYALALVVPHTRLALIQAIAGAVWGLCMIGAGIALALAGVAAFIGLITLLLAFPFGTIAYFAQYSCTEAPSALPSGIADALAGRCFVGVQAVAALAVLLKALALVVLLIASVKFLKVRGLIFAALLGCALGTVAIAMMWALGDLSFLLYPADAIVSALLGLSAIVYGVVVFVMNLFALARAIAGQVG